MLNSLLFLLLSFACCWISVTKATETVYTFDLCRTEPTQQFIDVTGDFLYQVGDTVTYNLLTTTCARNILGAYYAKVDGYKLEVYKGTGITGAAIDMNQYVGTNFSFPGPITAKITLTGRPENITQTLHLMFTAYDGPARILGGSWINKQVFEAQIPKYDSSPIILYMSFPKYLPEYGVGLQFTGDLKFEMYHGLSLAQSDLIYGESLQAGTGCTVQNVRPRFVYGNYVIFKLLNNTGAGSIRYNALQSLNMLDIAMTETKPLESPPCPPVSSEQLHEWSYELSYGGTGSRKTVKIDLLAPMRADSWLQFMEYNGETLVSDTTYNATSTFCGFQTKATSAIMNYYYRCKPDSYLQQRRELLFQYGPGEIINDDKAGTFISYFASLVLSFVILFNNLNI